MARPGDRALGCRTVALLLHFGQLAALAIAAEGSETAGISTASALPLRGCICTAEYAPVCAGTTTFRNACQAECAGATATSEGPCPASSEGGDTDEQQPVAEGFARVGGRQLHADTTTAAAQTCGENCPLLFVPAPVCGTNNKTYTDACHAACAKVPVAYKGACNGTLAGSPPNCSNCALVLSQGNVCGADGRTYAGACFAECNGTTVVSQGACPTAAPTKDCICYLIYKPVCGVDGKTYSNACLAGCAGVKVARSGACSSRTGSSPTRNPCICTRNYKPVCGKNGKTYGNACEAKCAGTLVSYQGKCYKKTTAPTKKKPTKSCPCSRIYKPVCGKNGKTYSNSCLARCAGVTVSYQGKCYKKTPAPTAKPCICTRIYKPVCGNGRTYGNACEAKCAGVTSVTQGACTPKPTEPRRYGQLPPPPPPPPPPPCCCFFCWRLDRGFASAPAAAAASAAAWTLKGRRSQLLAPPALSRGSAARLDLRLQSMFG
mmetsp:Transcript_17621/g.52951  ORF Transcript_17621/g.52951 Transcript_17621/m.52951 type:complete len:490 (-) Transcript_17621:234-1703(-)